MHIYASNDWFDKIYPNKRQRTNAVRISKLHDAHLLKSNFIQLLDILFFYLFNKLIKAIGSIHRISLD